MIFFSSVVTVAALKIATIDEGEKKVALTRFLLVACCSGTISAESFK